VNNQSGRCIDIPNWDIADGAVTPMDLRECYGGTNQKFAAKGLIEEASTGECLDVDEASFADGTQVITWPCNPNDKAQPWYFSP
jgi:endo-1,4-beta-xylanase